MELGGKKGHGGSGRLPEKLRPYKSGHRGLGAPDGDRKPRDLSEVHPDVLEREEAALFSSYLTQPGKRTISWQAEGVGCVKERKLHSKRVAKTSGMISSIKE